MSFAEQLRRAEQLAKEHGSLVIGSSPILTGGSPVGFGSDLPPMHPGWFNDNFAQPLRAPEPPEPEPETRYVVEFKGQTMNYVAKMPGESYPASKEKLVNAIKQEIEKTKFKPPKPRCDLDAGLDLDREVVRRCNFPGRTGYCMSYNVKTHEGYQSLMVHHEARGYSSFSPSTDLNHAMEAAERTGVLFGRVLFYSPDAGWLFLHDDEYMNHGDRGRRGATKAAVAICRHIVDAVPEPVREPA